MQNKERVSFSMFVMKTNERKEGENESRKEKE